MYWSTWTSSWVIIPFKFPSSSKSSTVSSESIEEFEREELYFKYDLQFEHLVEGTHVVEVEVSTWTGKYVLGVPIPSAVTRKSSLFS